MTMFKSKTLRCIVWFLCFSLSVFLLLVIPSSFNSVIWITLAFDTIAFISQFLLWSVLLNRIRYTQQVFNRYPCMVVSGSYLFVEFVLCIVAALKSTLMTVKVSLVINFVVMVVSWIIILLLIISKNHVERVDIRQKKHHIEL